MNQLDLYGLIFGELTADHRHGERIEFEIEHEPWNQLARVRVRIPSSAIGEHTGSIELLSISRFREGSDECLPVEISQVSLMGGVDRVETERGPDATTIRIRPDGDTEIDGALILEFTAWELVSPPRGNAPYLVGTLGVVIEFGGDIELLPVVVLLKTPKSVTPRSTQGNHALAYPSRTSEDHRLLGLYFVAQRVVTIRYTSGATDGLLKPWEVLGRSAVSAALVFLAVSATVANGAGDRFLVLLAAFAAAGQVAWDAAREIATLSIYGRSRRTISAFVLGVNGVMLGIFFVALLALSGSASVPILIVRWASLAIAGVAIAGALVGLLLHRAGTLHGYACDFLFCDRSLGLRRRRRVECRYTGRVFCDAHLNDVCGQCVHGADLEGCNLDTSYQYSATSIICVSRQVVVRRKPVLVSSEVEECESDEVDDFRQGEKRLSDGTLVTDVEELQEEAVKD